MQLLHNFARVCNLPQTSPGNSGVYSQVLRWQDGGTAVGCQRNILFLRDWVGAKFLSDLGGGFELKSLEMVFHPRVIEVFHAVNDGAASKRDGILVHEGVRRQDANVKGNG